jgi:hypothetical protein
LALADDGVEGRRAAWELSGITSFWRIRLSALAVEFRGMHSSMFGLISSAFCREAKTT